MELRRSKINPKKPRRQVRKLIDLGPIDEKLENVKEKKTQTTQSKKNKQSNQKKQKHSKKSNNNKGRRLSEGKRLSDIESTDKKLLDILDEKKKLKNSKKKLTTKQQLLKIRIGENNDDIFTFYRNYN